MIRDEFKLATSDQDIGYYAGFIATCYSLATIPSSYLWGYLSDKIGRRPIMLLGLGGTFIAAFLFGISKTFTMAVIARFFHGFMNGNIGITKTYLAEITDSTNKAQGFSILGIAGGIGRVGKYLQIILVLGL